MGVFALGGGLWWWVAAGELILRCWVVWFGCLSLGFTAFVVFLVI